MHRVHVEFIPAHGMEHMPAHQPRDEFSSFEVSLADAAEVVAAFVVDRMYGVITRAERMTMEDFDKTRHLRRHAPRVLVGYPI